VAESRSEKGRSASWPSRRWLRLFPILLAGFVTYAWASLFLSGRQTRALAERIRQTYALPRSEYHFPLHYLGEVVREGMTLNEVQAAVGPIGPLVKRASWHSEVGTAGKRWVAERLVAEIPWGADYPLDIFFREGRVSNLDSGYYISPENEISADSATRLLQ
jgi:hypothetical protein